jgi:Protein of unknown function (DUF3551)
MTNPVHPIARAARRGALLLGTLVLGATLAPATAAHAQGAWCAYYGGPGGGTNCGFYTLQQCRAALSGIGGTCSPSPWAGKSKQRRKVRRTY